MLTVGKLLIIITLLIPILIGSLFASIVNFIDATTSKTSPSQKLVPYQELLPFQNSSQTKPEMGMSITSGIWLLITFVASIFSIIGIIHL